MLGHGTDLNNEDFNYAVEEAAQLLAEIFVAQIDECNSNANHIHETEHVIKSNK